MNHGCFSSTDVNEQLSFHSSIASQLSSLLGNVKWFATFVVPTPKCR